MSNVNTHTQQARLRQELHDLCQPLTRLQWGLELGRRADQAGELREAMESALADSLELMKCIRRLRDVIENEVEQAHGSAA